VLIVPFKYLVSKKTNFKSNKSIDASSSSSVGDQAAYLSVDHEEVHKEAPKEILTKHVTDQGSSNIDNKVGILLSKDIISGKFIAK
jgi:hypothetical protein